MRLAAVAAALCSAGFSPAWAPAVATAAEPVPAPLALLPAAPSERLEQRRAVRGATIDERESAELRALREFGEDRFGRERRRELGDEGATAPADPEIRPWAELRPPDIGVRWEPRLLRFLEFFQTERRGHAIMTAWLKRQGRYRELIEAALEHHHLPHALLYVAMIESGYDPRDRSGAGASGLWQFMPAGARIYGLRLDHWVDERNDPEKSTDAVMRYFGDLHARFGSWHLALAAFNAGYGAVLQSVAKYNTNDYWALCAQENGLPWETSLYVPKVIAAALVGENRDPLGWAGTPVDPPWTFDRVSVPPSTTLANVARAAGVSLEAVAALNPELRRDRTPPERWMVRVPRGGGPRFLATFEPSRERVKPYLVQQGDRLETLARTFHASVAELRRLSTIRDAAEVRPGVVLVVPDRPGDPRGETAQGERKAEEPAMVAVRDRDLAVEGRKRIFYRVAPGDGTTEIARFFHVSEPDLVRWNQLDPEARLLGSQVLQLWVDPDFDAGKAGLDAAHLKLVTVGSDEFFDLAEAKRGRRRITHVVSEGDTLKSIGARYGLKEADLERINRIARQAPLQPGQALIVYVPLERRPADEVERHALPPPLPPPPPPTPPDAALPAPPADAVAPAGDGSAADRGGGTGSIAAPAEPVRAQPSDANETPRMPPPAEGSVPAVPAPRVPAAPAVPDPDRATEGRPPERGSTPPADENPGEERRDAPPAAHRRP